MSKIKMGKKLAEGFSGDPLTRWIGNRDMVLEEDFYYVDPYGKLWMANKNSCLNGATIPESLWSILGSPYVGPYRRASIVHDVAVGELCNKNVTKKDRKKADIMFYHACRYDGASKLFAYVLYIGVRFGTWTSSDSSFFSSEKNLESKYLKDKFFQVVSEASKAIEDENFDLIEKVVKNRLLT